MPDAGPQIIRITDGGDPRLADYANIKDRHLAAMARTAAEPDSSGLFMAEGELVVRQLIASGLGIKSVLITETRMGTMGDALAAMASSVSVYLTDQAVMSGVVGFHIHRGVLAVGVRPSRRAASSVIAGARTLVILEDLANHDNVGGIFRTAAAIGGLDRTGILLSPRCCDPFYRKAIRVSMGMAFRVPFAVLSPWPDGLIEVVRAGFGLIALTPDPEAADIGELPPLPARSALLLGAEGAGIRAGAASRATFRVRIPMDAAVDSLNVVVAAGVALHRVVGRR
jgi:tRNA G18 (ribose-2'-O)-methylase SpoU